MADETLAAFSFSGSAAWAEREARSGTSPVVDDSLRKNGAPVGVSIFKQSWETRGASTSGSVEARCRFATETNVIDSGTGLFATSPMASPSTCPLPQGFTVFPPSRDFVVPSNFPPNFPLSSSRRISVEALRGNMSASRYSRSGANESGFPVRSIFISVSDQASSSVTKLKLTSRTRISQNHSSSSSTAAPSRKLQPSPRNFNFLFRACFRRS
mmetsp:Transcript_13357/g.32700  ORF Transcript_13357/g.32700 Transcript_13357/m.32700 type:complete len:213 (-) Transcript_13357:993-1631(-)